MKLSHLSIRNTIGLRHIDVALDTPLCLFAGKNGSGKTSIVQCLRLALVAEPSRVMLKKDFDKLINEGGQDAEIHVHADGEEYAVSIAASGKVTDNQAGRTSPPALPFVLDMHRFSVLAADERRAFLFGLTGIQITGDAVMTRLKERGCNMALAEEVKPMLRAGFPAAAEYAKKKGTEGKGAWKATTGGETWGKDKAARWKAQKPAMNATDLDGMTNGLAGLDKAIEEHNIELGALTATLAARQDRARKASDLRERAERVPRIEAKLQKDRAELAEWEKKVADTREKATGVRPVEPYSCPHCGGLIEITEAQIIGEPLDGQERLTVLRAYQEPDTVRDPDAAIDLPKIEKARDLMARSVATGERDLADAKAAQAAIAELQTPDEQTVTAEDVDAKKTAINELKATRKATADKLEALRAEVRKAQAADEATHKAASIHKAILDWLTVAEALEPAGIPGELLSEALKPINDRLRQAAETTGWMQPTIGADMAITADGRPYALLSESEQWRADAMLTEAIAHLSGLRLLVLDRMDVLDLPGRSQALSWLHELANDREIDTGIVLATLKALPASLPPITYRCHWLDNGRIDEVKAAA